MLIILVGQGDLAYYLARQFVTRDHQVTIINPDAEDAENLARRLNATVLVGNGTDMLVLENAGGRRADVVIALTSCDADNLAVCRIAGKKFQVPRTISLVNDPDNEEVFHRLQVSAAISSTRIISTMVQEETGFEQIAEVMSLAAGKISVTEIILRDDAPALNQRLQDLSLPVDSLIAGIIHNNMAIVPHGKTRLQSGNRLILVSTPASFDKAMTILVGEQR
jgi:trk system potassium uptake protein TrkA